jgi:hypothetical protein
LRPSRTLKKKRNKMNAQEKERERRYNLMILKTTSRRLVLTICLVLPLLFFEMSNVYATNNTKGGVPGKVPIREHWKIHQDKYPDFATDLHFKLWQEEDNIDVTGWDLTISHFPSFTGTWGNQPEPAHSKLKNQPGLPPAANPDNGRHAVDFTASGANIPYCTEVHISGTVWLTEWNTKRKHGVEWTKEAQPPKKAVPNHGWNLDWPIPDPLKPGWYLHTFTIINDDAVDYLNVTGLTFNATMNFYPDLTQIIFPSGYPDFTLAPGQSWTTDISTSGPLYWGHIYFKYSLKGSEIYAEDRVDHPVTEPPSVGGIMIAVDKLALLAPYIGLASTILVATAATAIYVKRVKHRKEKQ